MDVEEFQWPTRLLSRRISPKPGLVERGSLCSVRDGGYPFGVDVFGSAMQLFDQIAARVLPGDWMPVLQTPTAARWPVGESTRSSASEEARYSPSRIRTSNDCAHSPPRPIR